MDEVKLTELRRFVVAVLVAATLESFAVGASASDGPGESFPAADWLIDVVDQTRVVGYDVSAATDPVTGETFISYYDGINGDLWLARSEPPSGAGNCGPGGSWECQMVDSAGVVGKYNSVAVGGNGPVAFLVISYHDSINGSLKVFDATLDRGTGALSGEIVVLKAGIPGSGVFFGRRTAVAITDTGVPHIVYRFDWETTQDQLYVGHAEKVSPGTGNCGEGIAENDWSCTNISYSSADLDFFDIDVNSGGTPFIAYRSTHPYSFQTYPIVAIPVGFGGSCTMSDLWDCTPVVFEDHHTGAYLSIAVDGDNTPHLAYRDGTTHSLVWAKFVGFGGNCGPYQPTWQCERIESTGSAALPSGIDMAFDPEGNPVIAYQDVDPPFTDLKIARPLEAISWGAAGNCGPLSPTFFPTWLCEILDAGNISYAQAVGGLSIAASAGHGATVAYRSLLDYSSGNPVGMLKVAVEPVSVFRDGFESGSTSRWSAVAP